MKLNSEKRIFVDFSDIFRNNLEEELRVTKERKKEIEMKSVELMEASEKASLIVASNMNG